MFTNQNQSSGKFWVSVFVVGLLVFLGQFANSKNQDYYLCKSKCGSQCYFPEKVSIRGDNTAAAIQQCQCGNNFCLEPTCSNKGMFPTGSSNPGERCSKTPIEKNAKALECPPGQREGTVGYGGSEKNACVCSDTGREPVAGTCTAADAGATKSSVSIKCESPSVGGTWQQESTDSNSGFCQCPDGSNINLAFNPNAKCQASNFADLCKNSAGGTYSEGEGVCHCYGNNETTVLNEAEVKAGQKCPTKVATAATDESEDAKFDRMLKECKFDEAQAAVNACESRAQDAVENCDGEAVKSSKNAKELTGVLKLLGTIQANKAVERADPDACGTAAYAGSAATIALDAFKKTCNEKVDSCKKSCNPFKPDQNNFKELSQNCEKFYNEYFDKSQVAATGRPVRSAELSRIKSSRNQGSSGFNDHDESRAWIRRQVAEMEKKAKDNIVKCEADAVKGETDIGNYLSEILTSSMAAAQCKNMASNSAARCAALGTRLTPQYCATQCGAEVCCAPYCGTIVDCNGKDYSTKQCVCARSPDSSGCKTVVSTPPPTLTNPGGAANLAGPGGIKAGSQYKPSGTVGAGGFEVGTDMDPSKPTQTTAAGGSTNPFGVASGGGGGGGGGVPNSPNDGSAAAAPAAEGAGSGLVGGAFNQLKTLADRVFGSGSGNSNGKSLGIGTGKDGKKIGDNNGKPGLRGVAGGSSVFGPRNKDIWKIMNVQYGIQNHTFITNEK